MGRSRRGMKGRRERFETSPELELKELVSLLQNQTTREPTIALKSRDKFYGNQEGDIPDGNYIEMNVTSGSDPRRLLLDVNTGDIFLTKHHYAPGSFEYIDNIHVMQNV
jgi:hypothetical protein